MTEITASDILNRYRKVKKAVKRANTWISLLALAEAGKKGLTLSQLTDFHAIRKDNAHTTLSRYVKLQLVYFEDRKAKGVAGRLCRLYFATPLLYQILEVKAPQD